MQCQDVSVDGNAANHFKLHPGMLKRLYDAFQIVNERVHTGFKKQVYAAVFSGLGYELFECLQYTLSCNVPDRPIERKSLAG